MVEIQKSQIFLLFVVAYFIVVITVAISVNNKNKLTSGKNTLAIVFTLLMLIILFVLGFVCENKLTLNRGLIIFIFSIIYIAIVNSFLLPQLQIEKDKGNIDIISDFTENFVIFSGLILLAFILGIGNIKESNSSLWYLLFILFLGFVGYMNYYTKELRKSKDKNEIDTADSTINFISLGAFVCAFIFYIYVKNCLLEE